MDIRYLKERAPAAHKAPEVLPDPFLQSRPRSVVDVRPNAPNERPREYQPEEGADVRVCGVEPLGWVQHAPGYERGGDAAHGISHRTGNAYDFLIVLFGGRWGVYSIREMHSISCMAVVV